MFHLHSIETANHAIVVIQQKATQIVILMAIIVIQQ
jgi:hypothetical protein